MDQQKTGRFLAQLRREKGITQAQLAEKIGTANKTVSRWETGAYMPDVEMLLILAEFYGVSVNELLSGERLSDGELRQKADDNIGYIVSENKKKYRVLLFSAVIAVIAVMLAFFMLGYGYACAVSIARITLSALLFGSVTSFWFSLAGGALALATLLLYKLILSRFLGVMGLSVMSAAMHNIGQCLACAVFFGHYVLTFYLPILLLVSLITGSLTAVIIHRFLKVKAITKG